MTRREPDEGDEDERLSGAGGVKFEAGHEITGSAAPGSERI